jgi:DHA1 family tetracycline resistance protein-like MFS transporter
MTRLVAPTEQGHLQGTAASLQAMTGLFSPTIFAHTFAYFISTEGFVYLPGAPFLVASVIMLLSLLVAASLPAAEPLTEHAETSTR